MDYLLGVLKFEQPGEVEAAHLRRWLLGVDLLLLACTVFFSILWFYLGKIDFFVASLFTALTAILGLFAAMLLAWRWLIWQSALLAATIVVGAAAYMLWVMPAFINILVSFFAINLIFVSIYLGRRLMNLYAGLSFIMITVFSFLRVANGFDFERIDWLIVVQYLMAVAVFGVAYALIWLNDDVNRSRSEAVLASEARYRLLFEASPISLWEEDGSAVMMGIEKLRQAGVKDFRTYFQENPAVVVELIGAVKVLDVNETAVSMYKAKDKTELMNNLERFLPEESYAFALDSLEAMANREPFFEREITNLTLDGEKLVVLYRWAIPFDQPNLYTRVIASIIDVTARKQVEDALQTYTERLRGLYELNLAINVKKAPEEIAEVALSFLTQFVPAWGAEIWSDDESGQVLTLLAQKIVHVEGERPLHEPVQPIVSMLSEEMQDDMRNNQPYVVEDLWSLRYLPPALMALKDAGMRSFMQLPLLVRGNTIGYLTLYDKNEKNFTPEYVGITREFAAPLAIALGNIQLYVLENMARNQAEILRRVAAELNSSLELEPLLDNILEYLQEVIPYDSTTIFLEHGDSLKIVAQRGLPQIVDIESINIAESEVGAYTIYKSGQAQIVPDTKKEPGWKVYPGTEFIRCWMGVPLKVKGKTIGALTLDKSVARFYTEKNQEMALAFANQAAIAIENARLYRRSLQYAENLEMRVDEQTRDLQTLYRITAVANTPLELDKILDESLRILLDTLSCISGAIFVENAEGEFALERQVSVSDELLPIVSLFESEDEMAKQILGNLEPLFVRDLAETPSLEPLQIPVSEFCYAGVGIRIKKHVVGILTVVHGDGKQFSPEDLALLSSVADQLGVVLENGRLRQQTQEVAVLQERERLARELHDSVTQSLYSLTLLAEASQDLSKLENGEKLRGVLGDIGITAQQALKEMRLMLYELRTGALGEEGLVNALRYRLDAVEARSGIEANIVVQPGINVPPTLHRTLYLIAQEALNNTLRHAKATEVFVTLGVQGGKLIMSIEDNGRGFSERTLGMGGMGLSSMRDRIEAEGGNLHINSLPGVGTKIELSIDLGKFEAD